MAFRGICLLAIAGIFVSGIFARQSGSSEIAVGEPTLLQNSAGGLSDPPIGATGAIPRRQPTFLDAPHIRDRLLAQGYDEVFALRREGHVYGADVRRAGEYFHVEVDAFSGTILEQSSLRDSKRRPVR